MVPPRQWSMCEGPCRPGEGLHFEADLEEARSLEMPWSLWAPHLVQVPGATPQG